MSETGIEEDAAYSFATPANGACRFKGRAMRSRLHRQLTAFVHDLLRHARLRLRSATHG